MGKECIKFNELRKNILSVKDIDVSEFLNKDIESFDDLINYYIALSIKSDKVKVDRINKTKNEIVKSNHIKEEIDDKGRKQKYCDYTIVNRIHTAALLDSQEKLIEYYIDFIFKALSYGYNNNCLTMENLITQDRTSSEKVNKGAYFTVKGDTYSIDVFLANRLNKDDEEMFRLRMERANRLLALFKNGSNDGDNLIIVNIAHLLWYANNENKYKTYEDIDNLINMCDYNIPSNLDFLITPVAEEIQYRIYKKLKNENPELLTFMIFNNINVNDLFITEAQEDNAQSNDISE